MPVETQQDFGIVASQENFLLLIYFFLVSCLSVTPEDKVHQEPRLGRCLAMSVLGVIL